jgi:nicotinamide riboside transporter PnuC
MTPDDPNAEPDFRTIADVAAYEAQYGREHLMHRVMNLRLHPDNRRAVEAWFWWEQQKSEERARQATVVAAEAARQTATWTFGIAIVTLLVVIATLAAPMLGCSSA